MGTTHQAGSGHVRRLGNPGRMSCMIDLRCDVVLGVSEASCRVVSSDDVAFAPQFPSPRLERVSPGHLVAIAVDDGLERIVWRWYDAVVLDDGPDGVRLWEPAHGEVIARRRSPTV